MKSKELYVISHSGGLDSTTLLAKALFEGKTVLPVNYNYGQANKIEMFAQQKVWEYYKTLYPDTLMETISIDFTEVIGKPIQTFQKNRDSGKTEEKTDTKYYMPSRNLLFMSMSAVIGEIIALDEDYTSIQIGLGIHKHSSVYAKDYWDITPKFAEKLNDLLMLNDNVNVSIYAPYADKYKSELIKDAKVLGVPYNLTWTCYEPKISMGENAIIYTPCGVCEACVERETQARTAGVNDVNNYSIHATNGVLNEQI